MIILFEIYSDIIIWNYYNGTQLSVFDKIVEEFNTTVGIEKGIIVISESLGNINDLANSLIESIDDKVGAKPVPALAAVYSETAYILDQKNALADFSEYFSEDELSEYIPSFIEEGKFNKEKELLLFPICKSTEVFVINKTDWDLFQKETGINYENITTYEDLSHAAEIYYNWTDSKTPDIKEDGKALYGRDSLANYIYSGSHQLGNTLFTQENGKLNPNFNKDTFKTLWQQYYIPFINGYYGAYGRYRSDDAKTGKVISLTCSTSAMNYMPTEVTVTDDEKYKIDIVTTKPLKFKNATTEGFVQQGASICMPKTNSQMQEGAAIFLKWFTDESRNLDFSINSGYMPVTKDANNIDKIKSSYNGNLKEAKGNFIFETLSIGTDIFTNHNTFYSRPFNNSKEIRTFIENSINEICENDRQEVISLINSGISREEATAKFITEEYFENWYESFYEQVLKLLNE